MSIVFALGLIRPIWPDQARRISASVNRGGAGGGRRAAGGGRRAAGGGRRAAGD
ncbi:MAG: hypothetical protein QOE99_2758 [Actinomycetota bacterium]|jgi:hypothetical protein|nr:hypothetical protein [Actinomycetota bacterium]